MNEMKGQICTSVEQSKRLLELGLKPETADMYITNMSNKGLLYIDDYKVGSIPYEEVMSFWRERGLRLEDTAWEIIPAWSFYQLLKLLPHNFGEYWELHSVYMWYYNHHKNLAQKFEGNSLYDIIINCLEWLINNGLFNQNIE